ncbi:MAG: hypothetical protein QGF59_14330, partial [Pirellulaceae bacterium]|nr:hypothetical protein [Pirellulaceae bacterium]
MDLDLLTAAQLGGLSSLQIVERAIVPTSPIKESALIAITIGILLGLILTTSLSLLFGYLFDVINSKDRF